MRRILITLVRTVGFALVGLLAGAGGVMLLLLPVVDMEPAGLFYLALFWGSAGIVGALVGAAVGLRGARGARRRGPATGTIHGGVR